MIGYRVFSPVVKKGAIMTGMSPEEYIAKYPELQQAEETKKLMGVELMWCWYYASPESPYNLKNNTHNAKCEKITSLIFDKIYLGRVYDSAKINYLKFGNIPNDFASAIDFFSRTDVETRKTAKELIEKMFEQYTEIIERGTAGFKTKDGEVDYQKFSSTMKLIRNELDEIIKKKEQGFAVTEKYINEDDDLTEGSYYISSYLKSK